jgi:hypothetical protein
MAPLASHMSLVRKGAMAVVPYPQVHVRLETMGEPLSMMTVLLNADSLATVACQLDLLEHLTAQDETTAF